tara:strand:- start:95 stop:439 length:345 start_codon:yes stop_codon:yes gene_type:complete
LKLSVNLSEKPFVKSSPNSDVKLLFCCVLNLLPKSFAILPAPPKSFCTKGGIFILANSLCIFCAAALITLITSSTNLTVANIPIAIPLIPISIALKNPLKSFSALNNSLNTPTQ